jgi:uroporphyrinogen decarboxylase
MTNLSALDKPFEPDWKGFVDNLLRRGTPDRVYNIELGADYEIRDAVCQHFGLIPDVPRDDEFYRHAQHLAFQLKLGYDYVGGGLTGADLSANYLVTDDTADTPHAGGRAYVDEHTGPIPDWEAFNSFHWPDVERDASTRELEWFSDHAPEGMCIVGRISQFLERLSMLMGYETLCYALYDQRDLVEAIYDRLLAHNKALLARVLQFERVKVIFASDDMGYKSGLLIGPDDMRRFCLDGHKELAAMAHAAGRPYLLHSCGNLSSIMGELVEDVGIDGKHSFEDTIEDVRDAKETWGGRIALLGGIDVDFLCRSDEQALRQRVRDTLEMCQPGGGYCLGTGNTVANYVPVENYLAMLDEGRRWR